VSGAGLIFLEAGGDHDGCKLGLSSLESERSLKLEEGHKYPDSRTVVFLPIFGYPEDNVENNVILNS